MVILSNLLSDLIMSEPFTNAKLIKHTAVKDIMGDFSRLL